MFPSGEFEAFSPAKACCRVPVEPMLEAELCSQAWILPRVTTWLDSRLQEVTSVSDGQ